MASLISTYLVAILLTAAPLTHLARALPCLTLPPAPNTHTINDPYKRIRRYDNPPFPYCNYTNPDIPTPLPINNATPILNASCPFQTAYPSSLRPMNSLYDNYESSPTTFFQVLRESEDSFQVATQLQFTDIPVPENVGPCALVLHLPAENQTKISGLSPSMNVYQVTRAPNATTKWKESIFVEQGIDIAAGNANITGAAPAKVISFAVGTVNGDGPAIERVRRNGGTVVVGYVRCNETLTFQIGMARPGSGPLVNYWDFQQVNPPATPDQGWRVVYEPSECGDNSRMVALSPGEEGQRAWGRA